jgi:hypothetical protein
VGSEEVIGDEPGGSGGGGGGSYGGLIITQEAGSSIINGQITITWLTNHEATSRVVYDIVSHSQLDLPPNYGYQWSTDEIDTSPMVTGHLVTISGLPAGTYYFRPISHGSPEVYGKEIIYLVDASGQTINITPPEEQSEGEAGGGTIAGETTGETGTVGTVVTVNEGEVAGETASPVVEETEDKEQEQLVCLNCDAVDWLIIILLLIIGATLNFYSYKRNN